MRLALTVPFLLLAGLLTGCGPDAPVTATAPASTTNSGSAGTSATNSAASTNAVRAAVEEEHYYLDHAQVDLPRVRLWIGPAELESEVCTTLPQVATGLMHRTGIGPSESMIFAFGTGAPRSFYMKNVSFDIAAAYIDTEGVVTEVVQLKKQVTDPVPSKSTNIQFVLETAPDWFERNGIKPGTVIRTDSGSLRDVLGRRAVLR